MFNLIRDSENKTYILIDIEYYEVLGYSKSEEELLDIKNMYKTEDGEYVYENLRIEEVNKIQVNQDKYNKIKNKELVSYDAVDIILKLDKNRDKQGFFAYFRTETNNVYNKIIEDTRHERFDFENYSFSNKEITLKVQSKDCLKVLDMCRSWKKEYYKNGLEWLMEIIGKHRKFG